MSTLTTGARGAGAARIFDASTRLGRALRALAFVGPLGVAAGCGVPMCPWASVFGQPCPGCGMTRAALALARADVGAALAWNPTAPLTVPLCAALAAFFVVSYVRDGRMRANDPVPRALAVGTIVLLAIVWGARAFGAFGGPVAV